MNLKLGVGHDINIYRMIMFFNTTGVCVWSLDEDD
jgi:hypothetical protein